MNAKAKLSTSYRFGSYDVDVPAGQLRKHGTKVRLSGHPFEILAMLLERAGEVVTRDEIRRRLWPNETFGDFENSLNKAINKLRQALADSAEQPIYIETLPRRGYRFIAALDGSSPHLTPDSVPSQREKSAAGNRHIIDAQQDVPAPAAQENPVRRRLPAKFSRWMVYVFGCLALVAGAVLAVRSRANHNMVGSIASVAVLPLDCISSKPGSEYLADGVTDELITQLAKTGAFRVTSRTSSMQFKKSSKSLRQIAYELGVDALVEGSIERSGERIRIRAQLIRASTDQHLWAESYDGGIDDLLSLEDRAATDITSKIVANLTGAQARRLVRMHPINPDAYQDYLRGRYLWNQRSPESLEKALRHFQAAIDKDPNYAAAYAGIADSYLLLGGYYFRSQNETIPKARAAAERALEIENLSEAHATLGLIAQNYDWDWPRAEREYQLAIQLNPNYSTAHHWYGEAFLAMAGRFEEALMEMKRATELDPLSPIISTDVGTTLYLARRYDEAIDQLTRTLEVYPDYELAQIFLALSFEQNRKCSEALSILDPHGRPDLQSKAKRTTWARISASCGRRDEPLKVIADLQRKASAEFVDPALIGYVFIGLGRPSDALTQLEKSVGVHSIALTSLKVNPIYDPLRSEPRFAALLQTVHLSQ
jgi:TolB-like protein/DNA-binding winged helix-turn-helix (wHTH) protein/Tfp pilus assembly protein PilF